MVRAAKELSLSGTDLAQMLYTVLAPTTMSMGQSKFHMVSLSFVQKITPDARLALHPVGAHPTAGEVPAVDGLFTPQYITDPSAGQAAR